MSGEYNPQKDALIVAANAIRRVTEAPFAMLQSPLTNELLKLVLELEGRAKQIEKDLDTVNLKAYRATEDRKMTLAMELVDLRNSQTDFEPPAIKVEQPLVINDEWRAALDKLNDPSLPAIFVTGNAGTGKTRLLDYFRSQFEGNFAIVAPTGVSAIRAGGQTIHSFFGFRPGNMEPRKVEDDRADRYKYLDALVFDEVSMVRADLMDACEQFLRINGPKPNTPWGGVRTIMFGDLLQLPPVVTDKAEKNFFKREYGTDTPYFFHAAAIRNARVERIELTTNYRQADPEFVGALNAVRTGSVTDEHLRLINARVNPKFNPPPEENWLKLTTTNAAADSVNFAALDMLRGPSETYRAQVVGNYTPDKMPTDEYLELKVGCPVMMIRNDGMNQFVNGTLGTVIKLKPLTVRLQNGMTAVIEREKWENIDQVYDKKKHRIVRKVVGEFYQVPIKIAAAITVHKSQGLSLDRVHLKLDRVFASGQTYVALSRATSLQGLVLSRPLAKADLILATEAVKWLKGEPIARPVQQIDLFDMLDITEDEMFGGE